MLARRLEICRLGGKIKYIPYNTAYTSSATWTVPYTQWYEIHIVGTGGAGGDGGTGGLGPNYSTYRGGAGGGGGSGGHTAGRYLLAAGTEIPLTIGTSTTFGGVADAFYMSVSKGENGGNGGNANPDHFEDGAGGSAGIKGRVIGSGNLSVSNTGNNGGVGSAGDETTTVNHQVVVKGGTGGKSPYGGYGAGGAGGNGSDSSTRNAGEAGGSGAVVITAYQQE